MFGTRGRADMLLDGRACCEFSSKDILMSWLKLLSRSKGHSTRMAVQNNVQSYKNKTIISKKGCTVGPLDEHCFYPWV